MSEDGGRELGDVAHALRVNGRKRGCHPGTRSSSRVPSHFVHEVLECLGGVA
jgi:hypothetical protein